MVKQTGKQHDQKPTSQQRQRMTFSEDIESVVFSPTAANSGVEKASIFNEPVTNGSAENEVVGSTRSKLSSDRRLSGVLRIKRKTNALRARNKNGDEGVSILFWLVCMSVSVYLSACLSVCLYV
jgi:hypothetical protein